MKKGVWIYLCMPLWAMAEEPVNPTTLDWYAEDGNRVSVGYRSHRASWHSLMDGDGGETFRLMANGVQGDSLRLSGGGVYYERGVRRNVSWCDVYDEDLLRPYLLADGTCADYRHESYGLSGSYAVKRGAWRLGLGGRYRGVTAYRTVDPRPQNTVSSLTLNPGVMRGDSLQAWGAYLHYQYYRQHVRCENYEPMRMDFFYLMRGLGEYDYVNSLYYNSLRRYYTSQEYGVGLQAHRGWHVADVSYVLRRLQVEESDYLKPYHLMEQRYALSYAYRPLADGGWRGRFRGEAKRQYGRERTYAKVMDGVWDLVAEQGRYRLTAHGCRAEVEYLNPGVQKWRVGASVAYDDERQRYRSPYGRQFLQTMRLGGSGGYDCPLRSAVLRLEVAVDYRAVCASELRLPSDNGLSGWVLSEFDYRAQNALRSQCRLQYLLPVRSRVLSVKCNFEYIETSYNKHYKGVDAGICYEF